MAYSLKDDYEFTLLSLTQFMAELGILSSDLNEISISDLLTACSARYGSGTYDEYSMVDVERHAELRKAQITARRLWYYYQVLKSRVENA